MQCPSCVSTALVMSERQGVEIDYCPACRGIWLDRGELDKLLDRAAAAPASQPVPAPAKYSPRRDFEDSDFQSGYGHSKYRKKSWLSEIFD